MSEKTNSEEPHNPKYVLSAVCTERVKRVEQLVKIGLLGIGLTTVLSLIELLRGFMIA